MPIYYGAPGARPSEIGIMGRSIKPQRTWWRRVFFEILLVTAAVFCSTEPNYLHCKGPVFVGESPCEPAGERFFLVGA